MPLLAIPLALLLILVVVLVPLGIIQRYRGGTARRQARPWLAAINAASFAVSVALLLGGAAIVGVWAPRLLAATAKGIAAGAVVGLAGSP